MPTATSEKLNQLREQLRECTNPIAAKILKSTIVKLEAQLSSGQEQTKVIYGKELTSVLVKSSRYKLVEI